MASDGAEIDQLRAMLLREVDLIIEGVVESLSPCRMPFSGIEHEGLRNIIDFVNQVDDDHHMGVEALDVIMGDFLSWQKQPNTDKPFDVDAAIFHAVCEWDL